MHKSVCFSGVALAALVCGQAHAQAQAGAGPQALSNSSARSPQAVRVATVAGRASPTSDALPNSPLDTATVGEIVVTANKRSEQIDKVGATITAIPASELAQRRIVSLADIALAVPGLSFAQSSYNAPILTLRGVGFNEQALGNYSAVSVYLDQAPLPFPVMASHTAYDLERVEVLKGPQGTLFGENATGGALDFIAAKPTNEFAGGGDVSFGRFNDVGFNAYLSGPLAESLRARVAVNGLNGDGWQVSSTRPYDRNGAPSYLAGRFLLDWDASSKIHFNVDLNGWVDKSQPEAPQFVALNAQTPPATAAELAYPFGPQNDRAADWSPGLFAPRADRKFFQPVLRADIDVTDDIVFTSISSYADFRQTATFNEDGTDLEIAGIASDHTRLTSFNQEVRLANSPGNRFRWVVGGNYEHSNTRETQIGNFQGDTVNGPGTFFVYQSGDFVTQAINNYAVFGNGEYDLSPRFSVVAGVRYTDSRNNAVNCAYDAGDGHINTLFNFLGNILGTVPFTPLTGSQCGTLNAVTHTPDITPTKHTLNEDNVSWRVGGNYKLGSNGLIYGEISRGYKAGSFPVLAATSDLQYQPVTQESITDYEVGIKKSFLDRRLHVDGAVFYYDYRDKQVLGIEKDPVFGPQLALVNVPKSRVYGFDGDVSVEPVRGLVITGALTYLNSRIDNYTGFTPITTTENFAGSKLPFAATWTYSASADYRFVAPNGGSPFIGLTIQGNSGQDTAIGGSGITIPPNPNVVRVLPGLVHPYTTNPYALVDLRIGYNAPNGTWSIMAWGKNVLDKYYWTNVITPSDVAAARFAGMPATYGVTLGVKFR